MKELGMKRPDLEDEKYRGQELLTDRHITDYICDTIMYVDKLELALYKKNEEIEELKEKINKLEKDLSSAKKPKEEDVDIYEILYGKPFGDPLDD